MSVCPSPKENGGEYCISLLAAVAKMQKLTDDDIELARHGKSTGLKEQALLDFVLLAMRHRGDLTDAEVCAVKDAGAETGEALGVTGRDVGTPILRFRPRKALRSSVP